MNITNESNHLKDASSQTVQCVACKEPIRAQARVCPKCGSAQHPSQWAGIGKFLKVAAGLTTVLSLIVLAVEVSDLASESREQRSAALKLVDAAQLAWDAWDENTALSLLDRADSLYPNLKEARSIRTDIGIATISRVYPFSRAGNGLEELSTKPDETGTPSYIYWSTIEREYIASFLKDVDFPDSLAITASESGESERARALAYLAWVGLINNPSELDIDIDKIFVDAIQASDRDPIANLFRATWLASDRYNGPLDDSDRIKQSLASFSKALESANDIADIDNNRLSMQRWIRALQLEALPAEYALGAVMEIRANGEILTKTSTLRLTRQLFIILSGLGGAPYPESIKKVETKLASLYSTAELVEISTWLASVHFGCTTDGTCTESGRESGQMLYAIGRMYELDGNKTRAHEYYQYARDITGLAGWWKPVFMEAIERTESAL